MLELPQLSKLPTSRFDQHLPQLQTLMEVHQVLTNLHTQYISTLRHRQTV